jgi:molybdate transport repressor ModE-like protein
MELLGRVQSSGSIAAAARELDLSYRTAWGLLTRWKQRLGRTLVVKERGRGTRLTPLGVTLVQLDAQVRSRLGPHIAAATEELNQALEAALRPQPDMLVLSASDDLALARLPDLYRRRGSELDLHIRGSVESLGLLSEGRCEVAGFHLAEGRIGVRMWERYRPLLNPQRQALIRVLRRNQGLMVAAANPKGVAGIADLSRNGMRYVNRQPGSGTRLLFDLMLREAGIDAARIDGYAACEHTHAAVAAMIASGQADAGMGVEAAARRFGLDFLPQVHEDYFLAVGNEVLATPPLRRLLAVLRGSEFRKLVAGLPGYSASKMGTLVSLTELFDRMDALACAAPR